MQTLPVYITVTGEVCVQGTSDGDSGEVYIHIHIYCLL